MDSHELKTEMVLWTTCSASEVASCVNHQRKESPLKWMEHHENPISVIHKQTISSVPLDDKLTNLVLKNIFNLLNKL